MKVALNSVDLRNGKYNSRKSIRWVF